MEEILSYVKLEIGGIQKFILGTGKLKEMVGGSELIESVFKDFLHEWCEDNGYSLIDDQITEPPTEKQIVVAQNNAGEAHLIFSDKKISKNFLTEFGMSVITEYPGLPVYGASAECKWSKDSVDEARQIVKNKIDMCRSSEMSSTGMPCLPFCIPAKLDGLPSLSKTCEKWDDGKKIHENVSLPSATKRYKKLIRKAEQRLTESLTNRDNPLFAPKGYEWKWPSDLEELLKGEDSDRIALIHMDGNDLGKVLQEKLREVAKQKKRGSKDKSERYEKQLRKMRKFSEFIEKSTHAAFDAAVKKVLKFVYPEASETEDSNFDPTEDTKPLIVPLRPCVLGGDDVTVIVRADLALLFVAEFIKTFEDVTQKSDRLSMGVGMVIANKGYPFLKAFNLAESLLENAKNRTKNQPRDERASSIDYLVITNDVQRELGDIRSAISVADDNSILTGKPFYLSGSKASKNPGLQRFDEFISHAIQVREMLPRSGLRNAATECRTGESASKKAWEQLKKNLNRGVGGRNDSKLLSCEQFEKIFADGFFKTGKDYKDSDYRYTLLGDYLELGALLPCDTNDAEEYLKLLTGSEITNGETK